MMMARISSGRSKKPVLSWTIGRSYCGRVMQVEQSAALICWGVETISGTAKVRGDFVYAMRLSRRVRQRMVARIKHLDKTLSWNVKEHIHKCLVRIPIVNSAGDQSQPTHKMSSNVVYGLVVAARMP